jgi:hypothetical protein
MIRESRCERKVHFMYLHDRSLVRCLSGYLPSISCLYPDATLLRAIVLALRPTLT